MSYTRRRMRRAINTRLQKYKHIVDASFVNVNGGAATQQTTVIQGADNPIVTSTNIVQTRARVRGFYFELQFNTTSAAAGGNWTFNWLFMANPQQSLVTPPPSTVGQQTTKNYVIKQGHLTIQTMASQGQQPYKVYGYCKIPAKYQRFMIGDAINFAFNSTSVAGVDQVQCKFIYKEIRG